MPTSLAVPACEETSRADQPALADARPLAQRSPRRGHHPGVARRRRGPNGHRSAVHRRRAAAGHPWRVRCDVGRADVGTPVPAACAACIPTASSRDRRPACWRACAANHGRRVCTSRSVMVCTSTRTAGVVFRQTTALRASDRTVRADGIVVASFPRLAFDLAADLRQLDHRSVVEQLLDRRLVTADELAAIGRRLCHPARRGSTTFRRTLLGLGGRSSRLASRGRPPRRPPGAGRAGRCAGAGAVPGGWRDDPPRPGRAGGAVGDRVGHPSRAPQRRRPPTRQPPGARPARRGLADRAGLRTRHGRAAASSPPSSPSCTAAASECSAHPRCAVRHSDACQHSDRGRFRGWLGTPGTSPGTAPGRRGTAPTRPA